MVELDIMLHILKKLKLSFFFQLEHLIEHCKIMIRCDFCRHSVNRQGCILGQITSGKRVGAQNHKCPDKDIKFSKS